MDLNKIKQFYLNLYLYLNLMDLNKIKQIKMYSDQIRKFRNLEKYKDMSTSDFTKEMEILFPDFIKNNKLVFESIVSNKDLELLDLMFDKLKEINKEFKLREHEMVNIKEKVDDIRALLRVNENMNKDIVIEELLKHYKTWDIYALSILYLKFYSILFKNGFFESKFIINFAQLLLLNISPDPNKRLESSEILQKYKDIFFINEKPENYLTLINNLNYEMI